MATIELFGVPRLRAGTSRFECDAATVGAALRSLGEVFPALLGSVIDGDRVRSTYILSINGDRFVSEPDSPLRPHDVLMLLSADVGG